MRSVSRLLVECAELGVLVRGKVSPEPRVTRLIRAERSVRYCTPLQLRLIFQRYWLRGYKPTYLEGSGGRIETGREVIWRPWNVIAQHMQLTKNKVRVEMTLGRRAIFRAEIEQLFGRRVYEEITEARQILATITGR